jgi:flagellar biosynthetic protein FlhB
MADDTERTEQPTSKRREDARKKGQVVLSPEVSPVVVLCTALMIASTGVPVLLARSRVVLRTWLASVGPLAAHDDSAWPLVARTLLDLLGLLLPFFLLTAAVGTGAVIAQVGWRVTPDLALPDFSRISPAKGLKRLFSPNAVVELLKGIAKIIIVALVAYVALRGAAPAMVGAAALNVDGILSLGGQTMRTLLIRMASVLAVLAAADFLWQRKRHEKSLKMSRQEVKEEAKASEGDPQTRMRFRRAHRELAKRRMLAEVPKADVVLTNPIHYAIALRYRPAEMGAPRVVAKGAGELAAKIKEAARKAGVPIVERRALARALYRTVEVGGEIPPTLYRAVAEILAFIYSLRGAPAVEQR